MMGLCYGQVGFIRLQRTIQDRMGCLSISYLSCRRSRKKENGISRLAR